MIKIKLDNPSNIENLHFNYLNSVVSDRLLEQINIANSTPDLKLVKFLEFIKVQLKTILIGKREHLEALIVEIEKEHYVSIKKITAIETERRKEADGRKKDFSSKIKKFLSKSILYEHIDDKEPESFDKYQKALETLHKKFEGYGKVLKGIFDYKKFTGATEGWSGYELASHLNVGVCPYCNRSFTTTLRKVDGQGKQMRPDYDHYYLQSRYEYLGLSLYNLIPSCAICNRTLKGETDFYNNEVIHPYEEEFLEVASFSTDFDYTNGDGYKYLLGEPVDFKVNININTTDDALYKRVENAIETFNLDAIYNSHKDIILDIIWISRLSTEDRFDELYKVFGNMFNSKEEFTQRFFMNYMTPENQGKRPLAKLTQDISKELGLLFEGSKKK
ncbi:hypothetical protein [Priestia megaterium]|uniref:HNH endonuclease n=1 Tax=Priestia megaterium TaxID=1404 RepID=A0A6M6E957_PRIMG|nr:hypothetical protein [Priestia megaterium]QJX80135.1 hypothetical protein FDZ14_28995 [Priestia megaterium]